MRALRWPSSVRLERGVVRVDAVTQDVQLALFELDAQLDQRPIGDAVDLDRRDEPRASGRQRGGLVASRSAR